MRVLMAAMKWDYGFPERGLSFEYTNMYDALSRMAGIESRLFDFMEEYNRNGHEGVRRSLMLEVSAFRPDLVFFVLFTDEIPEDVLVDLRDRLRPITFNWFCDDHWRFDDYSSNWAPFFNACSTTASSALPKYERIGYRRLIKTQWACNPHIYSPTGRPVQPRVTFIGQPHGTRRRTIQFLRSAGIEVDTWGMGWPNGRIDQDGMVALFSESAINLNLSNSSRRTLLSRVLRRPYGEQIKGRNFEIPACGGFQISGTADDIELYFEPGKEIVLFESEEELVDKVRRYQADDAGRAAIAHNGYRRTLAEHTYAHRFQEIFNFLSL